MKTILGILNKDTKTISYLVRGLSDSGEPILGTRLGSGPVQWLKKGSIINCHYWIIFPSHLRRLLQLHGIDLSVVPASDTYYLKTASASAIYAAGERLCLELGINAPAICWQLEISKLPDSLDKNLVWLASQKWLEHMNINAVKL